MASRSQSGAGPDGGLRLPDRYQLRRHLASGGMASVWCAEDSVLGRTVAVKVLAERFRDDEMAMRRFKREARAAARVSTHPHVVTIFDVGDHARNAAGRAPAGSDADSARPFIVMEYLAGGTVADALRVGAVRRHEALRWIREAGSALDHAHSAGIVHRDIKPANFLLDRSRVLHVADFGIARLMSEDTISSAEELFGTAAYLAPEQALGRPATGASDRYALAVAAFELLTGSRPFSATHFAAQARQHIEDPPPRASQRDRTLPAFVDDVLIRGMAKRPEERFASAAEFVDALDTAISGGIPVASIAPGPSGRRDERRPGIGRGTPSAPDRFARRVTPPAVAVAASALAAEEVVDAGAVTRPMMAPAPGTGTTPDGPGARSHPAARAGAAGTWTPSRLIQGGSRSRARGRALALVALVAAVVAVGAIALGLEGGHARRTARVTAQRAAPATSPAPVATTPESRRRRVHRATTTTASAPAPAPAAPAPPPSTAVQLQLTGHSEMLAGNYQAAIATLHRAVAVASKGSLTYAYGLYDLARSLIMAGNPTAAVPLLEARLKIPNQTGVVRQMLNRALRASGQVPAQLIAGTGTSSGASGSSTSSSSSTTSSSSTGSSSTGSSSTGSSSTGSSSTSSSSSRPPTGHHSGGPANGGASLTPVPSGPEHAQTSRTGRGSHRSHRVAGDVQLLD